MTNNEAVDKAEEGSQVEEAKLPISRDYYTVSDIADMVGISRQRIHQIIDKGILKPDIVTRFEFIFKKRTLDKFVDGYVKKR